MSNAPTHSVHSAITAGSLLLVLVLLLGCMTPDAALAVDGYESLGFRTISNECGPFGVGKYEAQDSSIAYCMNQDRFGPSTPGGPWLTYNQGWVWLEDEFAAIICMATPPPHPLAGITCPPIEHAPQPNLPSGCSTAPPIPTDHSHIQPPRASQRAETFPATMRSLPQRAGSTTAPSREALKPHRIARGAIWELCRAAASVKTCSTCSRPSPHPSKNSQPTPPSRAKTIPIGSTERGSTSMRAPATSVSAASRWTAAVAHRRHFCPIRHIIWSKPKLQRVISPGVTASPFPPAMTAEMSSSMSSPVPLPCASQRSMRDRGRSSSRCVTCRC